MNYTVTKLKSFMGMDCPGFNATLCLDGKPVADVIDDGSGGCMNFHWKDHKNRVSTTIIGYDGKPLQVMLTVEEAKLQAYVETLPPIEFNGSSLRVDADMFIGELVEDLQTEKEVKKLLKVPTIVEGKGKGFCIQFKKSVLDQGLRDYVKKTYPTAIFLNDLPFADAVKAYKAAG